MEGWSAAPISRDRSARMAVLETAKPVNFAFRGGFADQKDSSSDLRHFERKFLGNVGLISSKPVMVETAGRRKVPRTSARHHGYTRKLPTTNDVIDSRRHVGSDQFLSSEWQFNRKV